MSTQPYSASGQLSPGKLHQAHQDLEGVRQCTSCHEIGKGTSSDKCLTCHQEIATRLAAGRGLHAQPEYRECGTCHVEHHGRDFALIYWPEGPEKLDHRLTGYPLDGAHAQKQCRDCHRPENIVESDSLLKAGKDLTRTYLGLGTECRQCHADPHQGQLSQDCATCHSTATWKNPPHFDHARTAFVLTGRHQDVACEKCHQRTEEGDAGFVRYRLSAFAACTDCHRDPHENRLGGDCTSCHRTSGWRDVNQVQFDHDRTRYPLRGLHRDVACQKCHRQEPDGAPVSTASSGRIALAFAACTDCHADYHEKQLGGRPACDKCHTVDGYKPSRFSQADHQKTDYPLAGAHAAVPCSGCHPSGSDGRIVLAVRADHCQSCHRDAHAPDPGAKPLVWARGPVAEAGCEGCHVVDEWSQVTFDHARTEFPLQDRHRETSCRSCHIQISGAPGSPAAGATTASSAEARVLAAAPFVAELPQDDVFFDLPVRFPKTEGHCQDCHRDIHLGQLRDDRTSPRDDVMVEGGGSGPWEFALGARTSCDRCHDAQGWLARGFDHQKDARYTLDGAHINVPCEKCHRPVTVAGRTTVLYRPVDSACAACHGSAMDPQGGTR
ncbi:MAG: cytochrome c3 family protein [Candidatus Eisenbacteria bacterium]|uniref:Cytochrome c3 family protein n=1 Tax=Eiseniibacteriota bacterium TaxID=2212470 RepID=A0A956LYQ7_UNCEI|nr:cytochrome c3 family protein [Candidatus Eisenbacteria bacterium]